MVVLQLVLFTILLAFYFNGIASIFSDVSLGLHSNLHCLWKHEYDKILVLVLIMLYVSLTIVDIRIFL